MDIVLLVRFFRSGVMNNNTQGVALLVFLLKEDFLLAFELFNLSLIFVDLLLNLVNSLFSSFF